MSIALLSGLIIAVVLVVLLLLGIPIAIALGISSILAILPTLNFDAAILTGAQRTFSGISVFTLIAIPFFVLAGNIMNKGGIAIRLINFAKILTGRVPGALAHTNSVANMMFGAISGSGVAAASAMGSMIGPIAEKDGYDRDYMATINISTAPTGLLIPPSNVLITYSLVSGGTSVAALFMAGYIPGILWGVGCMFVAWFIARRKGYYSKQRVTLSQALKITLEAIPSLLLILIVIGGIIAGIFTATEGSVVAVAYSLILSLFFYKTIKVRDLYVIFKESAEMTGIIVFLIGVSSIMAWVMAFTGIPSAISESLLSISNNRIIILLIINIVLLFVGTFMDITPAILIFTPIFLPICSSFGMSPIQFGIMITLNLCIGTITPPVGNILFVGVKVAKTKIENVMKKLIPYYIAIFIVLMLTTYVPKVSMWLPLLMGYKK
ncbi:TRAP transporter large permease [Clostridium novyi]|uniref:TRAP transporter large permease n=1 Tax=Clostridium novyi TaxID=1542 RepID=UPI0004D94E28|nr:TRAP transporter large permease [Clostridium novyi]KEH93819.1 membrane protein [Clostridium novyi A str. GD211209]